MAAGPHEQRLRTHLAPTRRWQVFIAEEHWKRGADRLRAVADAVQEARPLARANLGSHTADAADQAFVAMHDKVSAREQQMRDGTVALRAALDAIGRAEAVRNGFDAQGPLSEPSAPDWDEDESRQIQQLEAHHARMSSYNSRVAAREEAALAAILDLDATNTSSAETMRRVQGDRPAPPTDPLPDGPTNPPTSEPSNPEPRLPGETGTPLGPAAGGAIRRTGPGAVGGAGGRGGRKKEEDRVPQAEAIDDDRDWADDEHAAPGVIS